jgi:CheY-like chemotaxis protein
MLEQADVLISDRDVAGGGNAVAPSPPRLLVIDDDKLHRMIICRIAAKAGYAPAGAASYDEAASLLTGAAFDCITLDLSIGAHDGCELLRHLSDIRCNAPIIVISGCDGGTCRESMKVAQSLNLNMRQSIPKPVDLVALRYWLDRIKCECHAAAAAA